MVGKPMTQFVDPNIKRKELIIRTHLSTSPVIVDDIPTFSLIEFNLTELCNRRCIFCPRVDPNVYPNRSTFIQEELYEKIMQDLAAFSFSGRVVYSAFSEPLFHNRLDRLIQISKRYCPGASVEIVSNGDLVHPKKLRWLFSAGLDTLSVSMYDGPHQIEHFLEMKKEVGLRDDQFILRKRYPATDNNFGMNISNRAGALDITLVGMRSLESPLPRPCFYPYYELLVDYDGTVLLCPHDWGKHLKAGNLRDQSVLEVWNGGVLTSVRGRLGQSDRSVSPCSLCNIDGTLMGEEHFEMWERYYKKHGNPER